MDLGRTNKGLGYSPLSARDRQIFDGSKYDKYFPKPSGKKVLLKRNGSVDDTVEFMKKIIKDYSWQVRKLCNEVLAVRRGNGELNIYETVRNIFDFVYKYIKYDIEDGEQLQTPAHSWYQAQMVYRKNPNKKYTADCDCMAIFCGSCMRELKIPFALRIAGYSNALGLSNGYQHVYVIAYDGAPIICDPVTNQFNYEKPYAMQKTFSLAGTDIYALQGTEVGNVYKENPDGTLTQVSGVVGDLGKSKAKKEKKAAKKAAKKEKRATKKAQGKGFFRKIGKGIAKVGKGIAKVTVKTSLLLPRSMFLVLLRLNFRGLARKMANNQTAYDKFAKTWKKLGGATSKLKKAVEKGKGKKALFGSKKQKGNLKGQLEEIGLVLGNLGALKGLGLEPTTTVASAMATAAPIIKKVLAVMKQVGENIPETAEEASAAGEDVAEASDTTTVTYNEDDVNDTEDATTSPTTTTQLVNNSVTQTASDFNPPSEAEIEKNLTQQSSSDTATEPEYTEYEEVTDDSGTDSVSTAEYQEMQPEDEITDNYDAEEYIDAQDTDQIEDLEETETMTGYPLSGYEDGILYIDDVRGLNGETLGKGLFKKVFSAVKNVASKVKSIKSNKAASSTATSSTGTKKKGKLKNFISKIKSKVSNAKANKAASTQSSASTTQSSGSTKASKGKQVANYAATNNQNQLPTTTVTTNTNNMANETSTDKKSSNWIKEHPVLTAGIAITVAASTLLIIFRKSIFGDGTDQVKGLGGAISKKVDLL